MAWRALFLAILVLSGGGCALKPTISYMPDVHNPFPQLTKVAVAPFFNHSAEPTVDGRQFANAYFNELQAVPGFEVVPVPIVEETMRHYGINMTGPVDARKLAQILQVDAVVVGAVTEFTPYYPPRCGMQVEWYAANPGYHPIPPGYGLPWGTPEEEDIPPSLVFEAQRTLAREQLKTQEPSYLELPVPAPASRLPTNETLPLPAPDGEPTGAKKTSGVVPAGAQEPTDGAQTATVVATGAIDPNATGLPPDWPDPRGFAPAPPSPTRPKSLETLAPVLHHTRVYNGTDMDFTTALESYVYFRNDARFGGWQAYLQRSDDFIRFCCHKHIVEMLTARGGAGQTRVVWRWPIIR